MICVLCVTVFKCPKCEKTYQSYSGLTRHAGLAHHLDRTQGGWRQLSGAAAKQLEARLKAQTSRKSDDAASVPGDELDRDVSSILSVVPSTSDAQDPPPSTSEGQASAVEAPFTPPPVLSQEQGLTLEPQENLPSLNLWPRSTSDPFLSCVGPSSDVEELRSAQHSKIQVRGVTHVAETPEELPGRELARTRARSVSPCSECESHMKRGRPATPPNVPFAYLKPSPEELAEWVFGHPAEAPENLAQGIVTTRRLPESSLPELADVLEEHRRALVHFARLLLLKYPEGGPNAGASAAGLRAYLQSLSDREIARTFFLENQ